MDTLGGETEFNLCPVLFADLPRDAFYLVPAFFSAGYPAGLAAGRAGEAATKAPDI